MKGIIALFSLYTILLTDYPVGDYELLKADLHKVNQYYSNLGQAKVDIDYKLFKEASDMEPSDEYSATIVSSEKYRIFKTRDVERIETSDWQLHIDHENKEVFYFRQAIEIKPKVNLKELAMDLSWIEKSREWLKVTRLGQGTELTYLLEFPDEFPEMRSIALTLNPASGQILSMAIVYKNTQSAFDETWRSTESTPIIDSRLVMQFSIKKLEQVKTEVNLEDYIKTKSENGKPALVGKLQSYSLRF